MNDLIVPDIVIGGFGVAIAILYGAWHEYTEKNHRDAKLLAAAGAFGLMGSAVAWLR